MPKPTLLPCPFCSGSATVSPTVVLWSEYRMETADATVQLSSFRFGKTAIVECTNCHVSRLGRGKTEKAAAIRARVEKLTST